MDDPIYRMDSCDEYDNQGISFTSKARPKTKTQKIDFLYKVYETERATLYAITKTTGFWIPNALVWGIGNHKITASIDFNVNTIELKQK